MHHNHIPLPARGNNNNQGVEAVPYAKVKRGGFSSVAEHGHSDGSHANVPDTDCGEDIYDEICDVVAQGNHHNSDAGIYSEVPFTSENHHQAIDSEEKVELKTKTLERHADRSSDTINCDPGTREQSHAPTSRYHLKEGLGREQCGNTHQFLDKQNNGRHGYQENTQSQFQQDPVYGNTLERNVGSDMHHRYGKQHGVQHEHQNTDVPVQSRSPERSLKKDFREDHSESRNSDIRHHGNLTNTGENHQDMQDPSPKGLDKDVKNLSSDSNAGVQCQRVEPSTSTKCNPAPMHQHAETRNTGPAQTFSPQSQQATSAACGNPSPASRNHHQAMDSDTEEATVSCCGLGKKKHKNKDSYRDGYRDAYRDAYRSGYRDGYKDAFKNVYSIRMVSSDRSTRQQSAEQYTDSRGYQYGAPVQFQQNSVHSNMMGGNCNNSMGNQWSGNNATHGFQGHTQRGTQPSSHLSDVSSHENVGNMSLARGR